MIISHRYKFVFIKTMKTAGTSIEVYLSRYCGNDDIVTPIYPVVESHRPRNHNGFFSPMRELLHSRFRGTDGTIKELFRQQRFYNHIPAYKVRARVPAHVWNTYFTFCVERNPWDKTLSHYYMLRRSNKVSSLEDYFSNGRFCHNRPLYTERSTNGTMIVDRVLRYEKLDEELNVLFRDLNIPFNGTLEVREKSDSRPDRRSHQKVFTDSQRQHIGKVFASEIQMHGYAF